MILNFKKICTKEVSIEIELNKCISITSTKTKFHLYRKVLPKAFTQSITLLA